jgi:two-component system, chemotaxis family, sensor kinase CheA
LFHENSNAITMDEFQKKFIEEATDLINDLENALLDLEKDPTDKNIIGQVFRVMHSLKGGGAMFGFDSISQFTHNLETIYDLVRNDKMTVGKSLLNITLSSVDHLKRLLEKGENLDDEDKATHKKLINDILLIIKGEDVKAAPAKEEKLAEELEKVAETGSTYYILFNPSEHIFNDGTNPLFLLDELSTLGNSYPLAHLQKIPNFADYNPANCYIGWEIFLATSETDNSIQDVFIFVQDECELKVIKIAEKNLLEEPKFIDQINLMSAAGQINTLELIEFAQTIVPQKKTAAKKVKKADGKEAVIASIRVASDKIDKLMNLVSELVTTQASLSLVAETTKHHDLVVISENVENLTRQLRDIAFSISLVPIETVLTRFQRLVRDLSNEFNKEISFVIEGADTELDKTLIQNLTDPIMHILRNCIDHGIESKEEREKKGKPALGTINFRAFYSGTNVLVQIQDDGAGINPLKIKEKAIQKGIISAEMALSDKDILGLIFLPGFSTASVVSDVSGRGVGMDVVKRKINEVRGDVEIESVVDKGTTITLKLPLTLSIIDGLLVKIDNVSYIVPLSVVDKIYAISHEQVTNKFTNVIILDDEQIPFYYLRDEFECESEKPEAEQLIVVKYEEHRIGLIVDTVIGEYQAVLKPLGRHYKNHEIISGATILGDGTVALVIDTNKIIKQFSNEITRIREEI